MASPLVTGRFDDASHQGRYGEAFVHALAAASGLNVGSWQTDVGIDWILATPGPRGTIRSPRIEVQVKSWSRPAGTEKAWHYPLRCGAFNHLAGPGHQIPHFLFLCIVPDDADRYAEADPDRLLLRRSAYWYSLAGERPDPDLNPVSTKTVHVPKQNLITPITVTALLEKRLDEAIVA